LNTRDRQRGLGKPSGILFAILVILLLTCFPAPSFSGQFRVTRVHDGETIRAEGHGIEILVRLAGVEAPRKLEEEERTAKDLALEAKSYLAEMTLNKVVVVEGHGLDESNRVLGVLFIGKVNVNLEMIKAGYAAVYRGDPPHPLYLVPYLKAEEIAKRTKRGIWSNHSRPPNHRQSKSAHLLLSLSR